MPGKSSLYRETRWQSDEVIFPGHEAGLKPESSSVGFDQTMRFGRDGIYHQLVLPPVLQGKPGWNAPPGWLPLTSWGIRSGLPRRTSSQLYWLRLRSGRRWDRRKQIWNPASIAMRVHREEGEELCAIMISCPPGSSR
jgi:hypothetical protein